MALLPHAARLQALLDRAVDDRLVFGTTFRLRVGKEEWSGASGDLAVTDRYFMPAPPSCSSRPW